MAHPEGIPRDVSHSSLFDLIENLCAACELVKDLPSGNGENDWNNFEDLWQQVQDRPFEDAHNMIFEHASIDLINSPLFEILFEIEHEVAPPKTFASATLSPLYTQYVRIEPNFTAKEFLRLCTILDDEFLKHIDYRAHPVTRKLMSMISLLSKKKINVLEFLSTEDTDALLDTCSLFKGLMHSLSASHGHVFIKLWEAESVLRSLQARQGFYSYGDSMHVRPYPPDERYHLHFDYPQLLQCLQNAEAHIDDFNFEDEHDHGHPSFDILHYQLHKMMGKVTVAEFMAGREPAEGNPGAIIYNHLINSYNPNFNCWLFWANIASNGEGNAFLAAAGINGNRLKHPRTISRLRATALVDSLQKVDVADIAREDMKCIHCWGHFDEVEEGVDNLPVQLPCDSRHILGRDCLIDILVKTGPLCPLCRVDIVALSARPTTGSV